MSLPATVEHWFWTDRSWQTVQTQIRLLLKEQSNLGLHCLSILLDILNKFLFGKAALFKFWVFLDVRNFRKFMVLVINPLLSGNPKIGTQAFGVNPDQMPHNAPSDQGLHCLITAIFV